MSTISTTSSLVDPSYTSTVLTDVTDTTETTEDAAIDTATNTATDSTAVTETTETSDQTSSTDTQSSTTDTDSISLSTRAQKLSSIASEFFTGAEIDFNELTERIYEYGLLSESEYQALGGGQSDESSVTDEVVQYIDNLSSHLAQLEEDQTFGNISLIELQNVLEDSKEIIMNIGLIETDSSISQQAIDNQLILTQVYDSDEFASMSEEDQITMASVIKTLSVIGTLNSGQSTNSSVSAYTDIAQY